jgi:anti-sigma28 factor (negative regulator of flagellin synthesis)
MSIDLLPIENANRTCRQNRSDASPRSAKTKLPVTALSSRRAFHRGVRQRKVVEIKRRIADGDYHIDTRVLARNILNANALGQLPSA